jgi:hypothetical protein
MINNSRLVPPESLPLITKPHRRSKPLKVGIIDLVARQPTKSIYSRIVNPNYTSLMPQVIAVWVEQLGHEVHYISYTGFEDLYRELPQDIDLLFISTFTQNAFTAYSISNLFRQRNVITILGGPHARAYAEDAQYHFDYVLGLTDRELIRNLLEDFSQHLEEGVFLSAPRQLESVPGIRERWKFAQKNLAKTRLVHVVPTIGSLGCPYKCSFCIDSQIDYQPLPYDQIREDLTFLQSQDRPPIVAWYDPNFGVRFNDYLNLIESVVPPGKMAFGAESSLSLLSEENLKRLKKNNFIVMLPGIESWFDFNEKSKQRKSYGLDKVKSVAEQVNMVLRYVPYVQVNFIFGLDSDSGDEPFELTKKFVDLAPGAYPNLAMITSFGNSAPLNSQYQAEGRVIDIPFPFLDGNSGLNVRPKHYSFVEFYDRMIDLAAYSCSPRRIWRRFQANKHPLPRWMNLLRAFFSVKGGGGNYSEIRHRLSSDHEFQAFYSGESMRPPAYYQKKIQASLGPFYHHLPQRTLDYLKYGESAPNPRISNALLKGAAPKEKKLPSSYQAADGQSPENLVYVANA